MIQHEPLDHFTTQEALIVSDLKMLLALRVNVNLNSVAIVRRLVDMAPDYSRQHAEILHILTVTILRSLYIGFKRLHSPFKCAIPVRSIRLRVGRGLVV